MSAFNSIKNYLINAGLTDDQFNEVRHEISKSNRRDLTAFSILALIFMSAMICVSFMLGKLSHIRISYIAGACAMLTILVLNHTAAKRNDWFVYVLIYVFLLTLMAFGIAIGVVDSYDTSSTTFIAMLMTCPLLFLQKPLHINITLLISMVGFCIAAYHRKRADIYQMDVLNTIVFGLVSMALNTYMSCIRAERFYLQTQLRRMSETDQLTGLRNRHSYDATLRHFASCRATPVYCLYMDVNGLHELNNTKGHEAGDRMLVTVAKRLRETFGESDTYRIGGDEFVAIGSCESKDEKLESLAMFLDEIEQVGYHVAVGLEFGMSGEMSAHSMIERAEKKMYAEKAAYYKRSGKDRRRVRFADREGREEA